MAILLFFELLNKSLTVLFVELELLLNLYEFLGDLKDFSLWLVSNL